MSSVIKGVTIALWLLPLCFAIFSLLSREWQLFNICLILIALYGAIWLWCKPSHFIISNNYIEIVFPAWRRSIAIQDVSGIRIISKNIFQQEFGWAMRIGAGGLWGGFGWLWTSRGGFLEFYISQLDEFVLISRLKGNSLLITPINPDQFVETVEEMLILSSIDEGE
jgi:hypothetical protein